jgi:sugar lactone lactonase YvrE
MHPLIDPNDTHARLPGPPGTGGSRGGVPRGRTRLGYLALPGLPLLLASCGGGAEGSALDPDLIPRLEVVEELRLGVAEGREEEMFGQVGPATVTDGGELWFFDGRPPRIHRFSMEGEPLGTVGREGEGPGEFSQVRGMLALDGGDVLVLDAATSRLTRFGPEGTLVDTSPLPEGVSAGPIARDLEGRLYLRARGRPAPTGEPAWGVYEWLRLDARLSVTDRLPAPPEDRDVIMVFGTTVGPVTPNMTETRSVLGGTGEVIWAHNRSYVLRRGSPEPETADTLGAVAARPVLKTPGERSELEERIRQSMGPSAQQRLDPEKPVIQDLTVDQDGRLWVRLRAEAEHFPERGGFQWQERAVWDVWSPDGRVLGRIELPPMHLWMTARGDRFWVRTFGPLGEPQVVQYRVGWAEASPGP